jgi:ribose transport system permease protein
MTDVGTKSSSDVKGDAPARSRRRFSSRTAKSVALPGVWLLIIIIFSLVEPSTFFTLSNFQDILSGQVTVVIISLALLLPLSAGDFDLSVASNAGLSAMLVAYLNVNHHVNIVECVVVALASGAVVGFVNGLLIIVFRVEAFICTLGISTVLLGITLAISNQQTIVGVDPKLTSVVDNSWFGISHCFFGAVVLTAVLWYVTEHTMVGRRVLFTGLGPIVARLSGVKVNRIRWGCLIASGLIASLGGVCYVGVIGAADSDSASGFLLPAFAAAFLGATTIQPGRFNAWGTMVATYFVATGFTALELLGAAPYVQQLFDGGILVVAVAISSAEFRSRRRQRAAVRTGDS